VFLLYPRPTAHFLHVYLSYFLLIQLLGCHIEITLVILIVLIY